MKIPENRVVERLWMTPRPPVLVIALLPVKLTEPHVVLDTFDICFIWTPETSSIDAAASSEVQARRSTVRDMQLSRGTRWLLVPSVTHLMIVESQDPQELRVFSQKMANRLPQAAAHSPYPGWKCTIQNNQKSFLK